MIAAATSVFLEPKRSELAREALRTALGAGKFKHLMLFVSFVRTAHYWTLVHPELAFEDNVKALIDANAELAHLLLVDKEAGRLDMRPRLFAELTEVRNLHEGRELEAAKNALQDELKLKDQMLRELRAAEREVAFKDERLQMALSASGAVGLRDWMVDTDLLHGDANFARLYGLDEAKAAAGVTMEEYQEFVVAEDIEPLRKRIRAVFERGKDFHCEYRLEIPGQPQRWVECKGRMVHAADGGPVRFSGTAVNITGLKEAEQQKQMLMEELSHRVENTFTMVQGIVSQSQTGVDPAAIARLQDRLTALGAPMRSCCRPTGPRWAFPNSSNACSVWMSRLTASR